MSIRLRPSIYDKVDRLKEGRHQLHARRPLRYEILKLVQFIKSNNLQYVQLSDTELVVLYRRKEIMYLDYGAYFTRKYIGVYYDYKTSNSMKLKGKYNVAYRNMLALDYSSIEDVASDIVTFMSNTYFGYKPVRTKL